MVSEVLVGHSKVAGMLEGHLERIGSAIEDLPIWISVIRFWSRVGFDGLASLFVNAAEDTSNNIHVGTYHSDLLLHFKCVLAG